MPKIRAKALDATGSGDAFWGTLLTQIIKQKKSGRDLLTADWRTMVRQANVAGGITTESLGAIPAMPDLEDIERRIKDLDA